MTECTPLVILAAALFPGYTHREDFVSKHSIFRCNRLDRGRWRCKEKCRIKEINSNHYQRINRIASTFPMVVCLLFINPKWIKQEGNISIGCRQETIQFITYRLIVADDVF